MARSLFAATAARRAPALVALLVALVALAHVPAGAQERDVAAPEGLAELHSLLGLPETLEIMALEGLDYARDLDRELLGGEGGAGWMARAAEIYDVARMDRMMRRTLARELAGADLAPMLEFFGSERGRRIIELEVAARRAFLEPDVEQAAREAARAMRAERPPRLELLERFIAVNDLVNANVAGALNANYAFYAALVEAGGLPEQPGEREILADVWAQEGAIREDTAEWLLAYLAMAYGSLDDADLEAYIAFSETPAGRRLNRAIFAAFDELFVDISRRLGTAAALFLSGEEL
jgi:hypothetical protein